MEQHLANEIPEDLPDEDVEELLSKQNEESDEEDSLPCTTDESSWCVDLRTIRLSVVVKSGEKFMSIRFAPLLFVDSFNIFPCSLADLIEDLQSSIKG